MLFDFLSLNDLRNSYSSSSIVCVMLQIPQFARTIVGEFLSVSRLIVSPWFQFRYIRIYGNIRREEISGAWRSLNSARMLRAKFCVLFMLFWCWGCGFAKVVSCGLLKRHKLSLT